MVFKDDAEKISYPHWMRRSRKIELIDTVNEELFAFWKILISCDDVSYESLNL